METQTKLRVPPEQLEKMRARMMAFLEFLDINNIEAFDAVPMAMRFIACTCKGHIDKKTIVAMFKGMVEGVYNGEE